MEPQFEQLDHEFSRFDETITPTMLRRCLGPEFPVAQFELLKGVDVIQCPYARARVLSGQKTIMEYIFIWIAVILDV